MKASWEMPYMDDLFIIAKSTEELTARLSLWKTHMESKGLRVNMGKTKTMCCGRDMNIP